MNPSIHSIVLEGYVSYKNLRKNHQLCIRVIIYIFLIEERNHKLFFRVMITQEKSAVFEWLLPVILSGPQMMLSSGLSSTSSDLCVRHYNYFYKNYLKRKLVLQKTSMHTVPKEWHDFQWRWDQIFYVHTSCGKKYPGTVHFVYTTTLSQFHAAGQKISDKVQSVQ